jgi:ribosomal-protein-alanine N-acetyltransferase
MPLRIDPLRLADIPEILEIEQESFSPAWSANAYERELSLVWARCFVLRVDDEPGQAGKILGVASVWILADEAQLMTIAVRRAARGRGYGERLLLHAIDTAIAAGARSITLEVRESNAVAQRLYRKYGFVVTGRRKNYYPDVPEDALLMTADGLQGLAYQERLEDRRAALEARFTAQPVPSAAHQ